MENRESESRGVGESESRGVGELENRGLGESENRGVGESERLLPTAPTPERPITRLQQWLEAAKDKPWAQRTGQVYERYSAAAFFLGGVLWDTATLTRIDRLFDNVFLLTYIVLLGALITIAALVEQGKTRVPWLLKYQEWYPAGVQFFLGALFSAYVVYYWQSASLTGTSVFLGLLLVLLVANEFMHRRLLNLYFLYGLYFLACLSFCIFFFPILTGEMGYATFLQGGLVSLLAVAALLTLLRYRGVFARTQPFVGALGLLVGLFGLIHLFYVQGWIPPVPLALRDGGIYHEVRREGDVFRMRYQQPAWHQFWRDSDEVFYHQPGAPIYCFAAIFAPTRLNTEISHVWMFFDPEEETWKESDRIGYEVAGGRDGGYRGYTRKRNIYPGTWRVDVTTADGRIVGRVKFRVVEEPPPSEAWVWKTYD